MNERLFHFVAAADIEQFLRTEGANWAPPSLESEGFIHLSFAEQLSGTLKMHFGAVDLVLLVEVDRDSLEDSLKVEVSRGDQAFPHVYRALRTGEALRTWRLERSSEESWTAPAFGDDASQDRPAGTPLSGHSESALT